MPTDLKKVTEGKGDEQMAKVLVDEAADTVRWLHGLGLKYRLMYERQAYERADGSFLFWGGLHVGNVDGGEGLIRDHIKVSERLNERRGLWRQRSPNSFWRKGKSLGSAGHLAISS
jgi:tricarballylate dehydrogenase